MFDITVDCKVKFPKSKFRRYKKVIRIEFMNFNLISKKQHHYENISY